MGGRGCTRSEAEQIEAVHGDERLRLRRGRHGEGRVAEHSLWRDGVGTALHGEDDVGLRGDDRFFADRLVAIKLADGVDAAGEIDDRIRGGMPSRDHGAAVNQRHHEHHATLVRDLVAQRVHRGEVGGYRFAKAGSPRSDVHAFGDEADFFENTLFGKDLGHADDRNPGLVHDRQCFLRTGARDCDDELRIETEDTFRRQLAHVADVGFGPQRVDRIEARGIDADDAIVEAKRIENFGDRAADGHDPCRRRRGGIGGVDGMGGAGHAEYCSGETCGKQRGERTQEGAAMHEGDCHLVRISLFWDVRRRR